MIAPAEPPALYVSRTVSTVREERSSVSDEPRSRDYTIQLEQPAAAWVQSVLDQITELSTLAEGWDSYGARQLDANTALRAVQFIVKRAYPDLPRPSVVPTTDGGIQFEWHTRGVDLEIAFSEDRPGVYFFSHAGGAEEEAPLEDAGQFILRLNKLGKTPTLERQD